MTSGTVSFARRLCDLVDAAPYAPLISMGETTLMRRAFHERSQAQARGLRAGGLRCGDLLTIALPNGLDFMSVAMACWKVGVTPQPVSARLPQAELDAIVALAQSPFVVGEPTLASSTEVRTPESLLETGSSREDLEDAVSPAWKAPTSGGSTGRPKLIVSGQPSLFTPDFGALWRLSESDTALMPGPLYHNGPFQTATMTLLQGGHLVLMPRFDAEAVLRNVEAARATWLYLVPTMMSRIQHLPEAIRTSYDLSSLRSVWHLAAPCPPWLKRAWIDWLGADVILEVYGATEGQAGTMITGAEWLRKPGSVGRPIVGEIKVVGPEGRDLPAGEIGDIFMRPKPGAPEPYHYRGAVPERTADGWETVGDVGHMDADGYVFLADRRSDMILVGGSNVYPAEVEGALAEHPAVQSCAVIGLPDADLGQSVHAIVERASAVSDDDLRRHLESRLVRYKIPRTFEFVTVSLRDESGKVRRSQLQSERHAGVP